MYPIMLNVANRSVVVIGGGVIGLRKTRFLIEENAKVTVVSDRFLEGFEQISTTNLNLVEDHYHKKYLEKASLIFVCTNDQKVNRQIVNDREPWQLLNDCSCKENSDFYNMTTIVEKDVVLALSTCGERPAQTKSLKTKLKNWLSKEITKF